MDQDQGVYTAFLIGVGRNSATFATMTLFKVFNSDDAEIRRPNIASATRMGDALYELDREARSISTWTEFHNRLGRDVGTWAAFTEEAAELLVPHWFGASVEYVCRRTEDGPTEFADVDSLDISVERLQRLRDLAGDIDSGIGWTYLNQFRSNMVVTTQPIFTE